MVVVGKRPVRVLDDDVVRQRPKLPVRPAERRIIPDPDNATFARGEDGRALRDRPIDRMLVARALEMTVTPERSLHDNVTARTERHRVIGVVGGGIAAPAVLPAITILVMPRLRLVGHLEARELKSCATRRIR